MRRIRQGGKHHGTALLVHFKKHSSAFPVCYFRIPDAGLGSALLRHYISGHIVFYQVSVNSQLCPFLPVCIGLSRSQSVPFQMVIVCIQLEHYAKFRHISQFFHRIIGKHGCHFSFSVYLIGKLAPGYRPCRKKICESNFCSIILNLQFRFYDLRIGVFPVVFMGGIEAGNLPLSVSCRHKVAVVIVRRSSPEIRLWNCLHHFLSPIFIGSQSSIKTGKDYLKVLSFNTDIMSTSDDFNLFGRFLFLCLDTVNILTKSYFMTCGCPYFVFLQKESHSNCILPWPGLLRNRKGIGLFR